MRPSDRRVRLCFDRPPRSGPRAAFPGVTVVELLIAMSVSAIVVTLSFIVLSDILKGFKFQTSQAQTAGDMIVAKKQIDCFLSDIISVSECSDIAVTCVKSDADTFVSVRFENDSLCLNNKAICRGLAKFSFSLVKKASGGRWALLWNARLHKGGWFGGAAYGDR